jgi:hypothetical protein
MDLGFRGEVADFYHRYRRGYPPAVIDDVVNAFRLTRNDVVVEGEPGRLDVVGGRVRPGAACPQHDREGLAVPGRAVVGEGGQRVEAEGFLPSRRGLLFLRVGDHDRGVHVDGDQPAIRAWRVLPGQRPRPLARRRPGGPDGLQRPRQVGGQSADQPGHHRVGRDRPGQLRRYSSREKYLRLVADRSLDKSYSSRARG